MITTATITFHASHNYGSMLQAYALQQTILELGIDNEIINLRTSRQKKMYSDSVSSPFSSFRRVLILVIKNILFRKYLNDSRKKYYLFEKFLSEKLLLTKEYSTLTELENANLNYDCFIAGGDQIWNVSPEDFDWSYYLPFVNKGNRISYAVSMGP